MRQFKEVSLGHFEPHFPPIPVVSPTKAAGLGLFSTVRKKQGIHDGIWGIYPKFGNQGANVGASDTDLKPSAIVPVIEIGLQKFEKENNLSVDAAVANPKPIGTTH